METTGRSRSLTTLRPDPHNREIFDPLEGQDLRELADSIRDHGLINPVTIRPDGSIIAGEQRYRAAQLAGLAEVPVIVLDVSDEQAEVLRIEENLRRRTLKPSEAARAIRRLYEIHNIVQGRHAAPSSLPASDEPNTAGEHTRPDSDSASPHPKTAEDVAHDAGMSPAKARVLNRLADLIEPLRARLDARTITQKMAYGFAQLPPSEQEEIAADLEAMEREVVTLRTKTERFTADMDDAVETLRTQKDAEIAQSQNALQRLKEDQEREVQRIKAEEEETRRDLERANKKLREDLAGYAAVEHWKRHDKMHATLQMLDKMTTLRPDDCAALHQGVEAISAFLENDRQTAIRGAAWLSAYAHALGDRLGGAHGSGLRSVK